VREVAPQTESLAEDTAFRVGYDHRPQCHQYLYEMLQHAMLAV